VNCKFTFTVLQRRVSAGILSSSGVSFVVGVAEQDKQCYILQLNIPDVTFVFALSKQVCGTGSLHPQGHPMTTATPRTAIKERSVCGPPCIVQYYVSYLKLAINTALKHATATNTATK
jgi:hypothetical protein